MKETTYTLVEDAVIFRGLDNREYEGVTDIVETGLTLDQVEEMKANGTIGALTNDQLDKISRLKPGNKLSYITHVVYEETEDEDVIYSVHDEIEKYKIGLGE